MRVGWWTVVDPNETCLVLKMCNTEHSSSCGMLHHWVVKTKELTPRQDILRAFSLLVVQRPRRLVNCLRGPYAPRAETFRSRGRGGVGMLQIAAPRQDCTSRNLK